jgi:hypothetical protein
MELRQQPPAVPIGIGLVRKKKGLQQHAGVLINKTSFP